LVIYLTLHKTIRRREEVLAVVSRVKTQNVCTEEVEQHLVLPGAHTESLGVRPWDMPEQHDRCMGLALAQQPGQQSEVIVLNQHDGIVLPAFPGDDSGKLLVYRTISLPIALTERR